MRSIWPPIPGKIAVVTGQPVDSTMRERARQLRRNMTEAERVLWDQLRAHRLGNAHFRRQQVLGNFIVDFYCADTRLVIEVDGPVHDAQTEHDRDHDIILIAHHVQVMRFTNEEVLGNLTGVLDQIRAVAAPHTPLEK